MERRGDSPKVYGVRQPPTGLIFCPPRRRHKLSLSKTAVIAGHENRNSNDRPGFYPTKNTDHTNFLVTMCASPATRRQINQTPPRPHIQRESVRWHCAARREITERSEEAPAAKAAQPSRNDGSGKSQRGASGGMQGGPRRGRSPITGPALPPPEAAQTKIKKSPRARRAQNMPLKDQDLLYLALPPAA